MKPRAPTFDRVSTRKVLSAEQVEGATFPVLHAEAAELRRQVGEQTSKRGSALSRYYYITYEELHYPYPPLDTTAEAA